VVALAYWLFFTIPVLVFCVCFFAYYLSRVYPKKSRRRSRIDQEFALLEQEEQLPEDWLEWEMLDLSVARMREDGESEKEPEDEPELQVGPDEKREEAQEEAPDQPVLLSKPLNSFHRSHKLTARDLIAMLVISAVYAVVAFWGLGSGDTPESFAKFESRDTQAVLELTGETDPVKMTYFTGIGTGKYALYCSEDGSAWDHMMDIEQKYSELLKWKTAEFPETAQAIRYIKITGVTSELYMGEAVLYDGSGNKIAANAADAPAEKLVDEGNLPVISTSYLYKSYFDEIYHARTAYEHLLNIYPYEVSHPPLGKITIGIGIRLFGMNPFGWRFIGTLFGVLMLPVFYIFLKTCSENAGGGLRT
jgi:hypothetical protein